MQPRLVILVEHNYEFRECMLSPIDYCSPQPLGRGYIAIILTKLEEADTACSKLMTEDEYQDYLTKKCENSQTVISSKNK